MYTALQILRTDPATANGFAPAELLIGRKLVYPLEIAKKEIDFSGTNMTLPLVKKLFEIHTKNFGVAGEKINIYQEKYKKSYDKRKKTKSIIFKKGSPIQVKNIRNKRVKGKNSLSWKPRDTFYTIEKVDMQKKNCHCTKPPNRTSLKKTFPD